MLSELDAAVAARDAAAARVADIAADVTERVTVAADASIGERAAVALARRLYWEYPQVPVAAIASLLRVSETRVSPVVGPLSVELRCRVCGSAFAWQKPSRHALPDSACPDCKAAPIGQFEQMHGWRRTPEA